MIAKQKQAAKQAQIAKEKIKTFLTTIKDSSNYTEDQKKIYSDVLRALDMIIHEKLSVNEGNINIIDSLFNKYF